MFAVIAAILFLLALIVKHSPVDLVVLGFLALSIEVALISAGRGAWPSRYRG